MRIRLAERGPPVQAPTALGVALGVDVLVAAMLAAGGPLAGWRGWLSGSAWAPWAAVGYAVALVAIDLFVARLRAVALTWRRRLGYLAIVAVAWKGGPFAGLPTPVVVLVLLWVGGTWIALLLAGRALSRAIAGATGEDKPE